MGGAGTGHASHQLTTRSVALAALLYVALTLLLAYPLTAHPAGTLLTVGPDPFQYIWTLAWDTHAFTHQPFSIFDANIYYPQRHTLAYSENLIGSAVFAAPVLWVTGNPVLAVNIVALLSCVLCGLGAFILARRVGVGTPGAALAGIVFAFSPPRFLRIDQVHLTAIQWIPFSLAAQHAYWDAGRRRDLWLAVAFFTLQALTSGHGAVFLTIASLGLLAYRLSLGEPIAIARRLRDAGVPGALLLVPAALILLPYFSVQGEMGLKRTLADWRIAPSSFLASPSYVHSFLLSIVPNRINQTADAELFPGYLPLLLAAAAFWRPGRPTSDTREQNGTRWKYAAVALEVVLLASFVVALWVMARGALRLQVGERVLFSAGQARRAWMFFALCAALRLAITRRGPLDVRTRLRDWLAALGRSWAARRDVATLYGLLTLLGWWLAIGPPYGIWRFVYWLPGLNFVRAPARFTLLGVLGLAVLAGIGFDRLTARVAARRRLVLAAVVGALLVAEFAVPIDPAPYRVDIPAIDRWLAGQPRPFAVAEVPMQHPHNEWRHTAFMFHAMAHWQKTVHGYSGIRPQLHEELYVQLTRFPDEESLQSLQSLGVNYVVVHSDLYPPDEWSKVGPRLEMFSAWLKLEHVDGAGRVYSIRPAAAARP